MLTLNTRVRLGTADIDYANDRIRMKVLASALPLTGLKLEVEAGKEKEAGHLILFAARGSV
jgi:hypothetical protein